jgi:hypothetical protein
MRCEVCHGVVLSIEEERTPAEMVERDGSGGIRTYTVHCCAGCRQVLSESGAKERNPKGGAV